METVNSLLLTFLELTFVFVGIVVLYSQRNSIGRAPFYLVMGALLVFGQILCGADLRISELNLGPLQLSFPIGPLVIFMPFMAAILMVYVTEGALTTQRMIIGSVVTMGVFFYLGDLTRLQARWITYSLAVGMPLESFDFLLERSRRMLMAIVIGQVVELFMLPIVFSRLRNTGYRLFYCCAGALFAALTADSLIYLVLTDPAVASWWEHLYGVLIVKAVVALWLALLLTLYIARFGNEHEAPHSRALEIVIAFFGSYGRSKLLEANLLEWEGRYRLVLENASEMIMIIDHSGRVLDANRAAGGILGTSAERLINDDFVTRLQMPDGRPFEPDFLELAKIPPEERRRNFNVVITVAGREIHLALSISLMVLRGLSAYVFMGRDMTEEFKLAQEKALLSEELAHSQRLEALGQLAGGIAHDFNNNIHAILGHADLMTMSSELDEKALRHLAKITDIAAQSGKLTSQLLGFARKGKYQESEFDLRLLVCKSADFFTPGNKDIELTVKTPPAPVRIRGDQVQLQQVIVNLLLNARDALSKVTDRNKLITMELWEIAAEMPPPLPAPPPDAHCHAESCCCLVIRDNGCGMDEATRGRLFEPFFTTKPVGQGTGMGLAMAYGTVSNHGGWIQAQSEPDKGSVFYLFLPRQ